MKVLVALSCALCLAPASALAAAPANDGFANREVLSGSLPIEVTRSNVEATNEAGEFIPGLAPAGHSIWFEWEATSDGWVTIGACDNAFPTILAVFTGTEVDELTPVANGNDDEGPDCPYSQRQYSFKAESGTKYVIAVDGNIFHLPESPQPVTEGDVILRIEETPTPPNDDFANATPVAGSISEEPGGARFYFANVKGFTWTATTESGEPDTSASGASVWYSWTAPEEATYNFGIPCCQGALELHRDLYTGDALDGLTPFLIGGGVADVHLVAGTTLWIRVSGALDSGTGDPKVANFDFNISASLAPLPPAPVSSPSASPPDTTAPETTIGKRYLTISSAKFWLSSTEPGGFLCRLDKAPFKPCPSPRTYKRLKPGSHVFRAKAVDAAGNIDPTPAVARFKVVPRRR